MSSLHISKKIFSTLALSLLLTSCSGLGGKELTTYDLTAPQSFPSLSGRSNAQILVSVPTALKSLNSEMIVVRPGAGEITYLGDAQWSDRLPRMMQEKLIQTFENSARIRSVAKPGEGVVVDYNITTNIRGFELVDEASDYALVALSVKIIHDRSGRVRATKIFQAQVPLASIEPETGVAALDEALNVVLRDVLSWVVRVI